MEIKIKVFAALFLVLLNWRIGDERWRHGVGMKVRGDVCVVDDVGVSACRLVFASKPKGKEIKGPQEINLLCRY